MRDLFVTAAAPAGWYDTGENVRRWFDGRGWTEHYAPAAVLAASIGPVATRGRTNHGFHLIMAIMTIGLWVPLWAAVCLCDLGRSLRSRSVSAERAAVPRRSAGLPGCWTRRRALRSIVG
ncbi:MAG: DUF2510 domain-containing protein [Burkholderiaceae bacterium]|nr:DUF2510 domain-containing protein [Microbacteriaceae bacterium]